MCNILSHFVQVWYVNFIMIKIKININFILNCLKLLVIDFQLK